MMNFVKRLFGVFSRDAEDRRAFLAQTAEDEGVRRGEMDKAGLKGLVIDEPWIGLILRGEKTWEMRKTACHQRGMIALIRKGSGQIVGTAEITDSLPPLESLAAYSEAEPHHRIPSDRQPRAFGDGWRTPWVLTNVRRIAEPVSYKHPSGAVIWVNLDQETTAAVRAQAKGIAGPGTITDATMSPGKPQAPRHKAQIGDKGQPYAEASAPVPGGADRANGPADPFTSVRTVRLSGGNVRNNHIYLPLDFFPEDAIGGKNKSDAAPRMISVIFKPGRTVDTDIDRSKRILRTRAAVREFFALADVQEGDTIRIMKAGSYRYEISKETVHETGNENLVLR
jgi:hypothetical protein